MNQTADQQLAYQIFYIPDTDHIMEKGKLQNVYNYSGKHHMEFYRKNYMSSEEFEQLMETMDFFPNRKGFYFLRINKDYLLNDWH